MTQQGPALEALTETPRSEGAPRPLPVTDDLDTGGFWDAARRGELVVRRCSACGTVIHLPMAHCHRCGSFDGRWEAVSSRGRLHSWTVVEHQVHPAFPVPYTVVLVEVDDHPDVRFVGFIPGAPDLADGQPMNVRFEPLADGTVLPQWEPAAGP
jgi:uncharacterized protein